MPIRKRWSHHNVRIVGPSWDSMPEDLSRVEFPRKCTCRQFESYLRSSIIHLSVFSPKCAYFSSAYLVRSCDCAKPDCLCSSTIVWMFALYPNVCMTYMYCIRMFVWRVCIISECLCDVYVLYPNVCVTCMYCIRMFVWRVCIVSECLCDVYVFIRMFVWRVCIVSECLCDVFEANWKANILPVRTNWRSDQQQCTTNMKDLVTHERTAPCSRYECCCVTIGYTNICMAQLHHKVCTLIKGFLW